MPEVECKADDKGSLTKKAFERLLTKAAQPIRKPPASEAERTSESHRSGD